MVDACGAEAGGEAGTIPARRHGVAEMFRGVAELRAEVAQLRADAAERDALIAELSEVARSSGQFSGVAIAAFREVRARLDRLEARDRGEG